MLNLKPVKFVWESLVEYAEPLPSKQCSHFNDE